MNEITERLRDKYEAEGFAQGVVRERLQAIRMLERVAAAPDIDAAVMAEHARLLELQAQEVSAQAVTTNTHEARQIRQVSDAVVAGRQPLDNGDLVAAAMGLPPAGSSEPSSPPAQRQAGSQPIDNMDKVAAAMGL